eukprot:5984373-Pyramimonas_sp.AAC.1
MLHILAIERNLKQTWADQGRCVWGRRDGQQSYRTLDKVTLGVLGVGDIGSHVARTAKAFGMTVPKLSETRAVNGIHVWSRLVRQYLYIGSTGGGGCGGGCAQYIGWLQ